MTVKLHLGEAEATYEYDPKKTTTEVEEILEAKYGLFSTFYETYEQAIADDLVAGLEGNMEKLLAGKRIGDPFQGIGKRVEARFRKFLYRYEAERVGIPGTPTKAAKDGVRHVGKSKTYGRRRPSFIDTGLIRDNFRCWISEK